MKTTSVPIPATQESFNHPPASGLKFDFNFIAMTIVLTLITALYVVEFRRILATSIQIDAHDPSTAKVLVSQ